MRKALALGALIVSMMGGGFISYVFAQSASSHSHSNSHSHNNASSAAGAVFVPSFGDLMNLLIQPRHAKLWLAGKEQNWALAHFAYEELEESLETVAKVKPVFENIPTGSMVESLMEKPLGQVEAAIKARDLRQFTAAYDQLTQSCNACHAATNHPFIVIKKPDLSAYPNQDFRPVK